MTSYIKISQILKLKSKDITSKTLHAKFYASRIKNKRIKRGVKYAPPVWSVFKSQGKIGLKVRGTFKYTVIVLLKTFQNTKKLKNLTYGLRMTSLLKQWGNSDLRETGEIIYQSKGNGDESFQKM